MLTRFNKTFLEGFLHILSSSPDRYLFDAFLPKKYYSDISLMLKVMNIKKGTSFMMGRKGVHARISQQLISCFTVSTVHEKYY